MTTPLHLPRNSEWANREVEWYRGDNEAGFVGYRASGQYPPYAAGEITYRFDNDGYRRTEPEHIGSSPLCFYGDSVMFGYGLPEHHTIPFQFYLTQPEPRHQVRNFGWAGASNDLIARIILGSVPVYKPAHVFVLWTYFTRRELHAERGTFVDWNKRWRERSVPCSSLDERLMKAQDVLSNNTADNNNFLRNYHLVKYFLKAQYVNWTWGIMAGNAMLAGELKENLDEEDMANYCEVNLKEVQIDCSRDMMHPGVDTAKEIVRRFSTHYYQDNSEK